MFNVDDKVAVKQSYLEEGYTAEEIGNTNIGTVTYIWAALWDNMFEKYYTITFENGLEIEDVCANYLTLQ